MKIVECVPNFSEGRDLQKISSIAAVFKSFPQIRLADFSADPDHNRSVFTFLGDPENMLEAALAACGKALELIDMREQTGAHPRLGAVDVVPFIPLGRTKMNDAVTVAHAFGQAFYERFGVPVYYYGFAARNDSRVALPDVRRGGYEGLKDKLVCAEECPDVGGQQWNARAGATVVGAREPLVAYNINLASDDFLLARHIASRIREKGGGLQYVRAIGLRLKSRGLAQVSVNLTNCRETPLKAVFDRVKEMASEGKVEILESELIGLAPKCAFAGTTPEYLQLKDFDKNRLLETHIKALEKL
ncbi:MAG TPA: glutamate formimidoyltransferase [Smithella sp.]|nr:glutamate formimidoyltransferase [Smithella sp.]MDM7988539.1 glutamate formimidoyltransferase [Smithella sp.]HNY51666.1 glutamate formimidoyltransferase [Smithella sp.]HOG91676.1 glutamate formimidoyltransferase [Smithella sp.]HOU51917.1 glutamate formimidoyltransferase [Smithella sp.]